MKLTAITAIVTIAMTSRVTASQSVLKTHCPFIDDLTKKVTGIGLRFFVTSHCNVNSVSGPCHVYMKHEAFDAPRSTDPVFHLWSTRNWGEECNVLVYVYDSVGNLVGVKTLQDLDLFCSTVANPYPYEYCASYGDETAFWSSEATWTVTFIFTMGFISLFFYCLCCTNRDGSPLCCDLKQPRTEQQQAQPQSNTSYVMPIHYRNDSHPAGNAITVTVQPITNEADRAPVPVTY